MDCIATITGISSSFSLTTRRPLHTDPQERNENPIETNTFLEIVISFFYGDPGSGNLQPENKIKERQKDESGIESDRSNGYSSDLEESIDGAIEEGVSHVDGDIDLRGGD